jgi:hypothetical protein
MKAKIEVVLSDERLITPSGLCMVGQIFGKSQLAKNAARMKTDKRSQPQIKNGDILLTEIGMLTLGKTNFDYVNEFHSDPEYYKLALGIAYGLPCESTLRMRLDTIGQTMNKEIMEGNISMFKACKAEPSALSCGYVPVDLDVTPFDNSKSHKEGVSRTYKNFDGYAPMMAYIGTEGYGLNFELREGSQHCQKGTPNFLKETVLAAKQLTNKPLLFRMDSGNDAAENMEILHWDDENIKFLIKHNFRRENRYALADELREVCKNIQKPGEGKTVYIGSTWRKINTKEKGEICVRAVYEIIDITMTENGQLIFDTESEINLYLTSLELSDEKVIELYHNHAVCEQYHSEIKTDMDVERLPSGKFDTNALILKLAMLAYNILRIIGTEAMMKHDMPIRHSAIKRRRIRTVIDRLMLIAGHLTVHARKYILALGRSSPWANTFIRIFNVLAAA